MSTDTDTPDLDRADDTEKVGDFLADIGHDISLGECDGISNRDAQKLLAPLADREAKLREAMAKQESYRRFAQGKQERAEAAEATLARVRVLSVERTKKWGDYVASIAPKELDAILADAPQAGDRLSAEERAWFENFRHWENAYADRDGGEPSLAVAIIDKLAPRPTPEA